MLVTPEYETRIAEATRLSLSVGVRILQMHYLDNNTETHVRKMLRMFMPPHGKIADMGCGVGEVSRIMKKVNPKLSFIQVNNNQFQLEQCEGEKMYADMLHTGLPDGSLDGIMFNYSMGYCDLDALMKESHRLLRHRGVLFIYDMSGSCPVMEDLLEYRIHQAGRVLTAGTMFREGKVMFPKTTNEHFLRLFNKNNGSAAFEQLFDDTRPTAWRFSKGI